MSSHVESIEIISSTNFRVSIAALEALESQVEYPEIHPFERYTEWGKVRGKFIYPRRIPWGGSGSGNLEALWEEILPIFEGTADLVVTWESGMGLDGLRVRDGKVTHHKVIQILGDEVDA